MIENRAKFEGVSAMIFDYDGTIATIPIDWIAQRSSLRSYLGDAPFHMRLPENLRMDEMEAFAVSHMPDFTEQIFAFRRELESGATGVHMPIKPCINLLKCEYPAIRELPKFIVSNNLRATVMAGVGSLGLGECFTDYVGIDDTGMPKPHRRAADLLAQRYDIDFARAVMLGDSDATDGAFCSAVGMSFLNIKAYHE